MPGEPFAHGVLAGLLGTVGRLQTHVPLPSDLPRIDLLTIALPQDAELRQHLGVLARVEARACLFEPYPHPPTAAQIRACLCELLLRKEKRQQQATQAQQPVPQGDDELLWVISPTLSEALLGAFGARRRDDWESGIYFTASGWQMVLVAVEQLPEGRHTLLLRMLGRGQGQQQAIAEVLALAADDPLREVALRLLTSWRIRIQQQEQISAEEQELIMNLSSAYLEWEHKTRLEGRQEGRQEGLQEGLQQGLQQGRQEEGQRMLLGLLTERFGPLPQTVIERIEAITGASHLEDLAKAVLRTPDLQSFEQLL